MNTPDHTSNLPATRSGFGGIGTGTGLTRSQRKDARAAQNAAVRTFLQGQVALAEVATREATAGAIVVAVETVVAGVEETRHGFDMAISSHVAQECQLLRGAVTAGYMSPAAAGYWEDTVLTSAARHLDETHRQLGSLQGGLIRGLAQSF